MLHHQALAAGGPGAAGHGAQLPGAPVRERAVLEDGSEPEEENPNRK